NWPSRQRESTSAATSMSSASWATRPKRSSGHVASRWLELVPPGQVAGCHLRVGLGAGDGDDQVVGGVVGCLEIHAVEAVEHDHREPSLALVAIDERVVDHDGLQQCAGLGLDAVIGVPSEDAGAGAVG